MFSNIDMSALEQELIRLRREFHRYPETGWAEFRTSVRIIEELQKLGLTVRYGQEIHKPTSRVSVPPAEQLEQLWQRAAGECDCSPLLEAMRGGYTGCVTVIKGHRPGPTVAIRVDIDSIDLAETDDPSHIPVAEGFASCHPGSMHACGHDAHAAIGIGVAKILCACADRLAGKVVLIFQPGEEGLRGAKSMTDAGILQGCDYFFSGHIGLHSLPTGTVCTGVTGILANSKLDVTFHGRSAHAAAAPEKGRNALAAAATATLNLLAIPPHHKGVSRINVGTLEAGTARNIIPDHAFMRLETRGATNEINEYMLQSANRICESAAQMHGCTCEILSAGSAGTAESDQTLADRAAQILEKVPGVTKLADKLDFSASEDVVTMMTAVQSAGGKATELLFPIPLKAPHHNDHFDIDEAVIGLAARCFAQLALEIGND
jgi:aminobenzoyl-glutamate utilization protein A